MDVEVTAKITHALNQQNLILPAGRIKVGKREYLVWLNYRPELVDRLNDFGCQERERRLQLQRVTSSDE